MYLAAYELTQVPLPYIVAYYTGLPLHCCLLHTDSAYCMCFMCSLLLTNVQHIACYTEASAGAYGTYVVRTWSRVEGSRRTYAEEAKSSTVIEGERHIGVLWGERPRLEKEVKLRGILRKTQTI